MKKPIIALLLAFCFSGQISANPDEQLNNESEINEQSESENLDMVDEKEQNKRLDSLFKRVIIASGIDVTGGVTAVTGFLIAQRGYLCGFGKAQTIGIGISSVNLGLAIWGLKSKNSDEKFQIAKALAGLSAGAGVFNAYRVINLIEMGKNTRGHFLNQTNKSTWAKALQFAFTKPEGLTLVGLSAASAGGGSFHLANSWELLKMIKEGNKKKAWYQKELPLQQQP